MEAQMVINTELMESHICINTEIMEAQIGTDWTLDLAKYY
jgi:hypothetical protein